MKQGKTIKKIFSILQEQRKNRRDIFVKTACIAAKVVNGEILLEITDAARKAYYKISDIVHRQLGCTVSAVK